MTTDSGFPPGFHILHQGQRYWPLGVRQFTNTDGKPITCIDWRSVCPDCHTTFTVSTGHCWKRPHARRCVSCRKPSVAVPDQENPAVAD
jgi:hypothetical protein